MDKKGLGDVFTALRSKKSQQNLDWDDERELYFLVLEQVPSEFAPDIVLWLLRDCKIWRPTTDQVYDFTRKLMGQGDRTGHDVIIEIRAAIEKYGPFGRQHPKKKHIRLPGIPEELSPVAKRFVDRRGGWGVLCTAQYTSEEWFWKDAEAEVSQIADAMQIEARRQLAIAEIELPALGGEE